MAAKDSFEIIDGESPKEFTEVTCELEEFEVHFEDHGEPPTNVGELSTRNETETEQPGQQGLSFGTFWQEHHDQMEKKAEDCEEGNYELFHLGQDGFNTRKQERRSKVRQLSEKINRESQKPVLGESQAHVAGLPHHTPGIYPQFLARHSTDQSLLNNNQTRTRNPQISGTRSQMRPDVDSQNLFLVGHTCPNHRNMPTEQDDTAGWPSTMERRRITERWCYCFRLVENDDDLRPICELCLRHRYRGPRTCSQMNQHVCCYCFQDGVGDFLSLPCHHKFHRDCIIAAIQLNMLNCPICGQAFLHLP